MISRWRATSSIVLPFAEELVGLGQLADDLLGRVPASFHRAVLLAPWWGFGLAQRVDQFTGTRSGDFNPEPPGSGRVVQALIRT